MSAVTLLRIDPAQNMARFYRLDVQPDLFGGWSLWREWGRIGAPGRVRHDPYPAPDMAAEALAQLQTLKELKGYRAVAR